MKKHWIVYIFPLFLAAMLMWSGAEAITKIDPAGMFPNQELDTDSDVTFNSVTADISSTLRGTANQVIVSNSSGITTLSTPQDLDTNATPQFNGMYIPSLGENNILFNLDVGVGGQFATDGILTYDPVNYRLNTLGLNIFNSYGRDYWVGAGKPDALYTGIPITDPKSYTRIFAGDSDTAPTNYVYEESVIGGGLVSATAGRRYYAAINGEYAEFSFGAQTTGGANATGWFFLDTPDWTFDINTGLGIQASAINLNMIDNSVVNVGDASGKISISPIDSGIPSANQTYMYPYEASAGNYVPAFITENNTVIKLLQPIGLDNTPTFNSVIINSGENRRVPFLNSSKALTTDLGFIYNSNTDRLGIGIGETGVWAGGPRAKLEIYNGSGPAGLLISTGTTSAYNLYQPFDTNGLFVGKGTIDASITNIASFNEFGIMLAKNRHIQTTGGPTNIFVVNTGAPPTANISNTSIYYAADCTAGNACPTMRTESGTTIQLDQSLKTTDSPIFGNSNMKLTSLGGIAIKLINNTTGVSVKGKLVIASTAVNSAVKLSASNEAMTIGVFLEDGVAVGSDAWVVVSGIAEVAFKDNYGPTRGDWVSSSSEAGYADSSATPGGSHFNEIGHCIETVAAGGAGTHVTAKVVLHFN